MKGRVIAVGWEPTETGRSYRITATIEVEFKKRRSTEKAEEDMKKISQELLNQTVLVIIA